MLNQCGIDMEVGIIGDEESYKQISNSKMTGAKTVWLRQKLPNWSRVDSH